MRKSLIYIVKASKGFSRQLDVEKAWLLRLKREYV